MKSYSNCSIMSPNNGEILINRTIIVDNDKIKAITEDCPDNSIDMHSAYVIPAFIDGHCHLGDTGAKELGVGLTVREAVAPPDGLKHRYLRTLTDDQLVSSIRKGLLEMLRCGIAVCADYREGGIDGVRALRKAAAGLPIKAMALGRPLATGTEEDPLTDSELYAIAEEGDGFGIASIKTFSLDDMKRIRKAAANKTFSIHIAESPSSNRKSIEQYSVSEVERAIPTEADFLVHLTQADENDIRLLKDSGMPIVCCPRTNLILGDGIPPVDLFTDSGIDWGIGSDNMMFSSPDIFREMDLMSRAIRGLRKKPNCLEPAVLLDAATACGAQAVGVGNEYGSLEPGKSASFIALKKDAVAFDMSHNVLSGIIHRAGPADIQDFVCNGIRVIDNGEFLL